MTTATPWDLPLTRLDGRPATFGEWRGQALLIVNVASRCGRTPQYAPLEAMYRRHHDAGFSILGFPCDQFGHQEPGSAAEIAEFCELNYGVTFPLFAKTDVNGAETHPLYRWLKRERAGFLGMRRIAWNFTKFLLDRSGNVVGRFGPWTTPERFADRIPLLLER